MFQVLTVEDLAEDAFAKAERVRMLSMMNTPTDYDERKKAFVQMAVAREAANEAEARLTAVIGQKAKAAPPSAQGPQAQ